MADLNEKQIYEALGIEYPDAGAKEQEPAEPVQQPLESAEEGGNGQGVADPAEGTEPSTPDATGAQPPNGEPMDENTRHENAARRRRQEQQAAIDKAVEEALALERQRSAEALEDIFTRAGLKNTITGQPIKSRADFEAWERAFRSQQIQREVETGQLTPETLEQAISQHPTVKHAERVIAEAQQMEQQRAEAAARQRVDAELQQIRAMDPSIETLEDLFASERGQEIFALTQKGLDLTQAYYLAHREDREKAIAEGARQHAAMLSRGKEHLKPNGSSAGSGAVAVPAAELAMYRMFMPNATEAEIQAHYNKHLKRN